MTLETETAPPQTALSDVDRPFGPAAAVIVAVGLGALTLGILTTLVEASTWFADKLQWSDRVGPLSGKSILAVLVFFASWAGLTALWRDRSPAVRTVVIATVVLLALGLLGTFPTFFQAFASD
jgi:hypothetical protein